MFISKKRNSKTPLEVADALEAFVEGTGGKWDWDGFISVPIAEDELDKIRLRCAQLDSEFPPEKAGHYCNEKGFEVIRAYIKQLRERDDSH